MTTALVVAGLATFCFLAGLGVGAVVLISIYTIRHIRIGKSQLHDLVQKTEATNYRLASLETRQRQMSVSISDIGRALHQPVPDSIEMDAFHSAVLEDRALEDVTPLPSSLWTRIFDPEP